MLQQVHAILLATRQLRALSKVSGQIFSTCSAGYLETTAGCLCSFWYCRHSAVNSLYSRCKSMSVESVSDGGSTTAQLIFWCVYLSGSQHYVYTTPSNRRIIQSTGKSCKKAQDLQDGVTHRTVGGGPWPLILLVECMQKGCAHRACHLHRADSMQHDTHALRQVWKHLLQMLQAQRCTNIKWPEPCSDLWLDAHKSQHV